MLTVIQSVLNNNLQPFVNSVGLIFDIIGAWFVAWEVVREYKGNRQRISHGIVMGISVFSQQIQNTQEFTEWEIKKYHKMKIGLFCLTIGFILQITSNFINTSKVTPTIILTPTRLDKTIRSV